MLRADQLHEGAADFSQQLASRRRRSPSPDPISVVGAVVVLHPE
jgi:hypothetical protein